MSSNKEQALRFPMSMPSQRWIWPVSLTLSLMMAAPSQAQSLSSQSVMHPRTTTFKIAAQSNSIAQMEKQVLRQINAQRQRHGLSPLQLNRHLSRIARSHSQQMASQNFYSHIDRQGRNHRRRVEASGLSAYMIGENLMKCIRAGDPAGLSVSSWMKSPAHRKNVLLPQMTETGVGIWRQGETVYVTQLYMEPK
ncbi:CAP domain-containing protein [Acaryochloris sp. IP29b_bin.148]|uniref:CAP domain-containing protein n=1 Tax=Acaryochloris sp. IP29b_bin.148 TaxID=2969218 RepID=UPI00260D09DD|nr:CAP domain-containing protein [Acaryochloris sp. IP29b_bin.148]